MSYPKILYRSELPAVKQFENTVYCRECGVGDGDMVLVRSEEALRQGNMCGVTMYSLRFDVERGLDTGLCELCFDGETLQDIAERREREDERPRS